MEYAKDIAFIKDFVIRTKDNIVHGDHRYEVTQLINSLVGLLVLPKERYYKNINDNMIDSQTFCAIRECIQSNKKLKLVDIVRHMRNAIAHFHIECKAEFETKVIDRIILTDDFRSDSPKPNFKMILPISLLEQFLFQLADAVVKSITDTP